MVAELRELERKFQELQQALHRSGPDSVGHARRHGIEAHTSGATGDHGGLSGLTDDDHTQYLKEEASGGLASEVPDHTHADAANCGTVAHTALAGVTSDQHHSAITMSGVPDYITLLGQDIVRGLIDLTADVTGDLPFANLAQASAASKLLGRGSAAGAGDWQEITLGTNLSMSGTTLNATGGGGGHTIRENGTDQTARTGLNFIDTAAGAGLITDDAGGDETEVNLSLYALLSGRSGGQTLKGGTAASENLSLQSTAHATRGYVSLVDDTRLASGKSLFNSTGVMGFTMSATEMALTGALAVNGTGASGNVNLINISPTATASGTYKCINVQPTITISGNSRTLTAMFGGFSVTPPSGGTGNTVQGLGFTANVSLDGISSTMTKIAGSNLTAQVSVTNTATLTLTNLFGSQATCTLVSGAADTFTITTIAVYDATITTGSHTGTLTAGAKLYGYRCNSWTKLSNQTHYPFYDAGISDTTGIVGNVFRSNTQFGSTTLGFGGGDGVISLANAATAPTSGATDCVIFYSSDDAAGHTVPSFYCEGTNVVATGQADSASSVRVKMRINGTVRTFLCI